MVGRQQSSNNEGTVTGRRHPGRAKVTVTLAGPSLRGRGAAGGQLGDNTGQGDGKGAGAGAGAGGAGAWQQWHRAGRDPSPYHDSKLSTIGAPRRRQASIESPRLSTSTSSSTTSQSHHHQSDQRGSLSSPLSPQTQMPSSFDGPSSPDIAAIDALLKEQDDSPSSSTVSSQSHSQQQLRSIPVNNGSILPSSASPSSAGSPSSPHPPLRYLIALWLFSSLSAKTLPAGALQNRVVALSLPIAQYALLLLVGLAIGWLRPKGKFGRSRVWGTAGRAGEEARRVRLFVGIVSGLATAGGIWQARFLDSKVWQALEVLLIPFISLLPLFIPTGQYHAATPSLTIACTASAFLVAFSLVGVPTPGAGVLVSLSKVGFDAARWTFLKLGMGGEKGGKFLMGAGVTALFTSLGVLLFAFAAFPTDYSPSPSADDVRELGFHFLASLFETVTLLLTLDSYSSLMTPAAIVFPRNLFLLLLFTKGRNGLPLTDHWLQMTSVLVGSSLVVLWVDPEVKLPAWITRTRRLSSGNHDWERGPSSSSGHIRLASTNSSSPPSPPPINPSSNSKRPSHPLSPGLGSAFSHLFPTSSTGSMIPWFLPLAPFLPLLIYILQTPVHSTSISLACSYLPISLRTSMCYEAPPVADSVDLVFAYWEEDLAEFKKHLDKLRENPFVSTRKKRKIIVYNKGRKSEGEIRERLELDPRIDEVLPLPNVGREGGTYLQHILLHYNGTVSPPDIPTLRVRQLADHTFFFQPHLAWFWLAQDRIDIVTPETGFAHFGPFIINECGKDMTVGSQFPVFKEIFNIFTGKLCPPGGQLTGWSGQFVVSSKRILSNPYHKYKYLADIIDAPANHWIHRIWGPNDSGTPENPAVGHSVERAWPTIFKCDDPKMAFECPGENADEKPTQAKCQCLD
ncbi:hypothetical protein T439DRAFT_383046 [Meredithblackwellia eburnea MCA 4105]